MTAILQRETDTVENFDSELLLEPASLLKESIMRKPQMVVLLSVLLDKAEPCHVSITSWYVVDGGVFLHKVMWSTGSIFGEIVQMYMNYMTIKQWKFETLCAVFDGYTNASSTKC